MAKKLTEEMVIARTKISDLSKIRRLNCWGSELFDVSLLQKMPNVEVLSLSINKINSLVHFQYCQALQELYIRQNDIRDLNQICYLQGLTNLRHLWLAENPCSYIEGYRLTVIRSLPQLQKLDNVPITQEEIREATRKGLILVHPEDPQESEEEEYILDNQQYSRFVPEQYQDPQYSPQRSPSRQENPSSRRPEHIKRSYSPPEYEERKGYQYYEQAKQSPYYEDYTNGEKHNQSNPSTYKQAEGNDISTLSHDVPARRERFTCPASHQPPFNRRPVTRNSNILSAVLCLVKELDYPSLEVVEMAVRCRMDEFEE